MGFFLSNKKIFYYKDLYPYSKEASVIEWYKDSPKLLRVNNLIVYGLSLIISIVKEIPLNIEFIELFFSNILKLKGHPFFNTSLASFPSNWIIALEWDKSVIAKSVSLKASIKFSYQCC